MPTPLLGPLVRRPLLVVALLAVTLFALLPAVTSAQTTRCHRGSSGAATTL